MLYNTPAFQSQYLTDLIKLQKPVTLYLKNGRKLIGTVMGMNNEVIFFRSGMTEVFYKKTIHAILPIKQKVS